MTLATLDEVVSWDEDGQIDGLQFDGRQRAIQEWRDRKEDEEYKALFEQLQKRNHARRKAATPEGKAKLQEIDRRYKTKNRERIRQMEHDRRKAKYEADPVVNECIECGEIWIPPYEQKSKRSKFCTRKCRNRYHGKRRNRAKGLRDMSVRDRIIKHLRKVREAKSKEIAAAIDGKLASVRCVLCEMVKAGDLSSSGGRPAVFSLNKLETG